MNIRAKTKRRLLILSGSAVVVMTLLAGLYVYRMHQIEQQAQEHRRLGMQAVEAGDYPAALEHLTQYRRRGREDVEATYHLAVARRHVERPEGRHLGEAIHIYESLLEMEPTHERAQRDLLELYASRNVRYDLEAVEMADRILQRNPEDVEAMRHKVISLMRLRRLEEALEVAQQAVEVDATDLRSHELILQTLRRLDRGAEQIVGWARQQYEAHPEDARFEALLGYAHAMTGDREEAAEWLMLAASRELEDAELVSRLVAMLADAGEFGESRELLERAVQRFDDDYLTRMLARRLWEQSRYDDLRDLLDGMEAEEAHSELVALKAAASFRRDDPETAQPLVQMLGERDGDNTAAAWAPVLEHVLATEQQDAQHVIEVCEEAVAVAPNIPYVRIYLAEALARIGETELAVDEWQTAARLAASWATPHIRLAQTLNATGRYREALTHAQAALRRSPNSLTAAVTLSEVLAELLDHDQTTEEDVAALVALLEEIQSNAPQQERTLPTHVTVLAKQGDTERARQMVAEAIDAETPPSEQTLLRLAEISRQHELGVTEQVLEASAASHGITANLAYAQAVSQHAAGESEAAREQFQQRMQEHGEESLSWQLSYARFLDTIEDGEAASAWEELARAHPDNINLQRTVLSVQSVQDDRELMDEVIGRIRELSGDRGFTWRMARARWLLSGEADAEQAREAVELLEELVRSSPNLVEPRLLLADGLRQVGDVSGAIEQLTLASSMQPNNMDVVLNLARLRLRSGDYEATQRLVNRVLSSEHTDVSQRRGAANLLARLGDAEQAITLLSETGGQGAGDETSSGLLLAELHLRRNRPEEAEQTYQRLMREQPGAQVIQAYANFLGAHDRHEEAAEVIDTANEIDLPSAVEAMLRAEYARRYDSAEVAVDYYRTAANADPQNASVWRRLVDFHLDEGEVSEALQVAREAHEAVPASGAFEVFVEEEALVRLAAGHQQVRPLVQAMLHDAEDRPAALESLRILRRAEQQQETFAEVSREIRRVADRHTRFFALQNLAVDLHLSAGELEAALAVAERAMQNFPNRPEPAARATQILATQGVWNRVLRIASDWRERELYRPLRADIAMAEAHLNLNDPRSALEQIEPYLEQARRQPEQAFAVVSVFVRGMIGLGEYDRASGVLEPLLSESSQWRSLWVNVAMQTIEDDDVAAAWLERVEAFIPEGHTNELAVLASYWYRLGERADAPEHRQRAMALLEGPAENEGVDANLLVTYAVVAYREGDLATAEAKYRRALRRDGDMPIALNNLAMLLAERGTDLDEALQLAERAVQAAPSPGASFYDTLAYVQMQREEYEEAVANFERAVELEPDGVEWRVNLAQAHHQHGDAEQAQEALEELESRNPDLDAMGPAVQQRLERLRQELAEARTAVP